MKPIPGLAALAAALGLALMTACGAPAPAAQESYRFALMGDSPYGEETFPAFQRLVQDINGRGDQEWVIHVGDTKDGDDPCTDERLRRSFELFQELAPPLIFTPGDNDWFDCPEVLHQPYGDYERLNFLRALYYPQPGRTTGGRAMQVVTQGDDPAFSAFVENVRWVKGPVVFATVHLVGLNRPATDPAVAARRMQAAAAWIRAAFSEARSLGSEGVFLATQADPWLIWGSPLLLQRDCPSCLEPRPGLEELYPLLRQESLAFPGQVVLAVGDSHIYRVDKPLYRNDGRPVENFTRVETFGNPELHWIEVQVEPSSRGVFTFRPQLVPGNRAAMPGD